MTRTAATYTNITKRCSLCLHEKLATLMYSNQSGLLKKRSELVSKCWHVQSAAMKTNFYCKRFIVMIERNIYTLRYPQIN